LQRSTEGIGSICGLNLQLKLFGAFDASLRCFELLARKLQTLSPKFL
jgi:hypothetical protein